MLLFLEMLPLIPHLGHFQILHVDVVLCAPHVNLPKHFFVMNFNNKSFACCLLTLNNINIQSITTIFFLTYATTKTSRISLMKGCVFMRIFWSTFCFVNDFKTSHHDIYSTYFTFCIL